MSAALDSPIGALVGGFDRSADGQLARMLRALRAFPKWEYVEKSEATDAGREAVIGLRAGLVKRMATLEPRILPGVLAQLEALEALYGPEEAIDFEAVDPATGLVLAMRIVAGLQTVRSMREVRHG